ncbi:hypothetical protein SBY92_002594 [Candida maltosa Xu316]
MSEIESNSEIESEYESDELDGFIDYEDEETQQQYQQSGNEANPITLGEGDEEPEEDRIRVFTTTLRPNETQAQKLLRAHISVLVTALGGPDHTSDVQPPPYKLGHDALACLKDIKRWIRAVDEKKQNFEVALACAESGLVANDLLVILCQWEDKMQRKETIVNKTTTEKIMLSCLELLVLLTWPIEFGPDLSEDQKLHFADIKRIHILYKKQLLTYNNGQLLKAAIRLVLPIIAKSRIDREPRENQILRMVLYLIRNILAIEPANQSTSQKGTKGSKAIASDLPLGVSQDDISINHVLQVFKKNKVLMLLLTISGSIGTEFDKDMFGELCLECIYLMIKGVSAKDVLVKKEFSKPTTNNDVVPDAINASQPLQSVTTTSGMQLQDLLSTESKKKKIQTQTMSSRHGRFGSLLSIRSADSNSFVVSGQEALIDSNSSMAKLDKSKKWKRKTYFKYDSDEYVKTTNPVYLNITGQIECMGSKLTGQGDLVSIDELALASYFLTIAWFLSYQREKIALNPDDTSLDYGSVGAALSEINFILIIGYFRDSYSNKRWNSLHVAMLCFKELLQISNSIFGKKHKSSIFDDDEADSQHEIDKELAEGIIRKLFSFSDFLNIITLIPQTAAKHSPDYLQVSISVVHILLKAFENFANEDVKLYIQSKRKQRKKSRTRINDLDKSTEDRLRDVIYASDEELDQLSAKEITQERKLDFKKTEAKFFHQNIVSTYIEYFSRYQDLSDQEIKICLSYFHRLFVIRKDYTGIFRLDFMQMLHKLRNHLPRGGSLRLQVEEFIYYFMKKLKVALERFPLPIELLFPRMEDTETKVFLATGELYEKPESNSYIRGAKLAKDLEFVRDFDLDTKIKILVSQLHIEEKQALLNWLISELDRIISDRILDSESIAELTNASNQFRRLFINNGYLRLLLRLVGFDLPYTMEETPELGTSTDIEHLTKVTELIKKWNTSQPVLFEDDKSPSFFLRTRESTYNDDEYEEDGYDGKTNNYDEEDDDAIAFETEGVPRKFASQLDELDELERQLSHRGKERDRSSAHDNIRGKARKKSKNVEHKKKKSSETSKRKRRIPRDILGDDTSSQHIIKSSEFVNDSDDESDDEKDKEFFDREERMRQLLSEMGGAATPQQLLEIQKVWKTMKSSGNDKTATIVDKAVKEVGLFVGDTDDEDEDGDVAQSQTIHTSPEPEVNVQDTADLSDATSNTSDMESEPESAKRKLSIAEDDEEEISHQTKRKRVVISDDEE